MAKVNRFERSVNHWLTTPEENAAGRLGLYRIIYAVSALMYGLVTLNYAEIATMPAYNWRPVAILAWMPAIPSADVLTMIYVTYIVSLVFLLFGLWTRWSTLVVLISGMTFAGIVYSFGKIDHSDTFMRVYIPTVMLFGPWGKLYSVDALLAQRRGAAPLDPRDGSLRFSWPILFLFWLLCTFFMMSGVIKAIPPGQWLLDPDLMRKFMLEYNTIEQPVYIRHVLANLPVVPTLLLWMGLAFELFYPLAVINKSWRTFYVSSTVFFHMMTGITLGIAFDVTLFLYILFFDLWRVFDRLVTVQARQRISTASQRVPLWGWLGMIGAVSAVLLISHYNPVTGPLYQRFLAMFSQNVWYIVVPIAAYGVLTSLPKIIRPIAARISRRRGGITPDSPELTSAV